MDGLYSADYDPYIDKSHNILKNKLGITSQDKLVAAESDITYVGIIDVTVNKSLYTPFSFDDYKAIHYKLFKDLYDWAGSVRTIDMSKQSTEFCKHQYIEAQGRAILQKLESDNYLDNIEHISDYIAKIAYYYSELNILHPFREGNGRTLRTVLSLLASRHNYQIAWDKMNPVENIEACKYAVFHDESKLEDMIGKILYLDTCKI